MLTIRAVSWHTRITIDFPNLLVQTVLRAAGKAMDRILISEAMFRGSSGLRFSGVGIMRHGRAKGQDRVLYTDHFPVVARFEFKDKGDSE